MTVIKEEEPLQEIDKMEVDEEEKKTEDIGDKDGINGANDQEEKKDMEDFTAKYVIGTRIKKKFGDEWYEGTFFEFDSYQNWYHIRYDDGDEEELTETEMSELVIPKMKGRKSNQNASPTKKKRKSSSATVKSKTEVNVDEDEDGEEDKRFKKPKKNGKNSSAVKKEEAEKVVMETTTSRFGRARKKVNYSVDIYDEINLDELSSSSSDSNNDDDKDNDVAEVVPKIRKRSLTTSKTKKTNTKSPKHGGKLKKNVIQHSGGDESAVSEASIESDDDSDDDIEFDDLVEESSGDDMEDDFTDDEDNGHSTKQKGTRKKTTTRKKGAAANSSSTATSEKVKAEPKEGKKKMSESFVPMDVPLFSKMSLEDIQKTKEYLDPCGMEATDDIIDRLVGEQVDKIGQLLKRALESDDGLGSATMPMQLGTACSGTDAPSLAMTLVQEQMELRGLTNLFNFDHKFSCELEPFKQAYLARNFDSVLYPDIVKLTDDEPCDVYGQVQHIPDFNLFVAGTSCKNFSMLRSTKRIDIEDKGCSGETFLAAVEVLFKEQPAFAIFENVQNAPWAKMQEYITGRVELSSCDDKKAIKDVKTGQKKDLMFILDKNGDIVVDWVPAIYGVRCGAVVAGFLKGSSNKLHEINWPNQKKKDCTLADLMKSNKITKASDTLVFKTDCAYCTHIVKVDTKDYGLPQTRFRTYMFVWRPDDDDEVNDDLGEYWEQIVKFLKSPVRHSLHSFILNVDHDIIRVFREALNGPAGRQTKRGHFLEPDFWKSANANLPHNKNVRKALGMKDMARYLLSWGPFGQKQIPPHYWLEYLNCNEQRRVDLLEILHASAIRDAESHDSSFSSFYWNLSQNASKEKHRTACPGIAGCVTPGGDFFLPEQGRPLLGCEKLLVQGIPYFRLALGNETEVQLGDLAGNAMSLTVVCATMLAATTCKQLRTEAGSLDKAMNILSKSGINTKKWNKMISPSVDLGLKSCSSAVPFFEKMASMAPSAIKSSIWCTCETSGTSSRTSQFLQCRVCRVSCCRNCVSATAGYQLKSHDTVDVCIATEEHGMGNFLTELRNILPPSLIFNKDGIEDLAAIGNDHHRVSALSKYKFCLHRIKRDRKKWLICYMARENNNTGEAIGEFRITVGELKREEVASSKDRLVEVGVKGELTSFQPARTEPLVYGHIDSCATLTVLHKSNAPSKDWNVRLVDSTVSLTVKGEEPTESPRVEIGLTDDARNSLDATAKKRHNVKPFQAAKKRGEERRWKYAENWKEWPGKITVNALSKEQNNSNSLDVSGTYLRASCRQTVNQDALWIRQADDSKPTLYILMRPNANRTGPDTAVISLSIDHTDASSILAIFPRNWEPCDALNEKYHLLKGVKTINWQTMSTLGCVIPDSNIKVDCPMEASDVLVSVSGLNETEISMLCRESESPNSISEKVELNLVKGQKAQQAVRVFNSICVVPILKHASKNGLKHDLSPDAPWTDLHLSTGDAPFGTCLKTTPKRPSEEWYYDEERQAWQRRSEPGASRRYYLALEAAPKPFEVWVDKSSGSLVAKYYPKVVAHQAARQLIEGRGLGYGNSSSSSHGSVAVSFRLMDLMQQSDPVTAPFKVHNCDSEKPTFVPLKGNYDLYDRQQKVVTKMVAIENSSTYFEELEMSEHEMPGSTRLSLIAKASRKAKVRGGVIADAIGAGKTVISIAIILQGLEKARKSRKLPRKSGATLVVVPPALIDQWESEIDKFSDSLKVIKIFDHNSLKRVSVQRMIEADVVICPVDILEAKNYFEELISKAKLQKEIKEVPKLPAYSGQMEVTEAKGIWIPATSQDPYAGSNNSNNQKRRNVTAYYTFIYLKAIQELRKQTFKPNDKGVPFEYFEWERVIVDEIHESLCTTKAEVAEDKTFKEKNRRAGRELLGITEKDILKRPLIFRKSIFGLTGTPLLDSSSRVIELASLMGNTYVIGLSSHWRKLERESSRDIFLHNYLEPKQSREVRKNIQRKCQEYLNVACCRNKTGEEMDGIDKLDHVRVVRMTSEEKKLYLKSQSGIAPDSKSLAITPADFDPSSGHDITKFLKQNASLPSRGKELLRICREILSTKGDEQTKIVIFTDGRIGAGDIARKFLCENATDGGSDPIGCTWLDVDDSIEVKNKKISWYQSGDATEEDRARPRALVLHFEHAAGLNLQTECHNLILFTPLYVGEGASTSDPVSDASTELQAIGRVFRAGQTHHEVNVYRIEVQGPNGEECLDGQLIRRNTDDETVAMAINAGE